MMALTAPPREPRRSLRERKSTPRFGARLDPEWVLHDDLAGAKAVDSADNGAADDDGTDDDDGTADFTCRSEQLLRRRRGRTKPAGGAMAALTEAASAASGASRRAAPRTRPLDKPAAATSSVVHVDGSILAAIIDGLTSKDDAPLRCVAQIRAAAAAARDPPALSALAKKGAPPALTAVINSLHDLLSSIKTPGFGVPSVNAGMYCFGPATFNLAEHLSGEGVLAVAVCTLSHFPVQPGGHMFDGRDGDTGSWPAGYFLNTAGKLCCTGW
jgi:hypothetical protein